MARAQRHNGTKAEEFWKVDVKVKIIFCFPIEPLSSCAFEPLQNNNEQPVRFGHHCG